MDKGFGIWIWQHNNSEFNPRNTDLDSAGIGHVVSEQYKIKTRYPETWQQDENYLSDKLNKGFH